MTAYTTCAGYIIQRLDTNWNKVQTPVVYDNEQYVPAENSNFMYFSVNFVDATQASLYNLNGSTEDRLFRYTGVIEANIFTSLNEGPGEGFTLADTLSNIYRGRTFNNVTCFTPRVMSGRQQKFGEGKWWSTPVFIGFQYDQRMA